MEQTPDIYIDYLISSTSQTSTTGLSRLLDNEISHDSITRFLSNSNFDDCMIEKQYNDEN